jgi:hypothetical protein
MRKPRSDSKLKTLPEDVQAQIADWCAQDSLQSAVSRCASELQLQTSLASMSEFFAWYRLRATFSQAEQNAQLVEQMLREKFPDATPEKIAAAGQLVFTMQAANANDVETFKDLEYLRVTKESAKFDAEVAKAKLRQKDHQIRQKGEELRLARERFKRDTAELFIKWAEDQRAKEIVAGTGTNAEKIEALGRVMFGEDWDT